ncbi:TonB-dependent receptor [uncultured Bacteroides sp.]|uniref:SusC/RagA family TonB-linked outer membrane protein n=1 Tax=uncultured Bacteroides sp. TaxID=162156 RepID=UPI002AA960B9|nr:TonB-dependent receptor [uncultured Bacteroides sp.]
MKPPIFLFCLAVFFIISSVGIQSVSAAVNAVQQQRNTVTGIVEDSHGEPIIGANVKVKDSSIGTITDLDGVFKLTVPLGSKLVISFIGYETVTVQATTKMKVVLEENSMELSEVEVVAYGAQKKVTVTGAISSVKGGELTKTPTGSISNMLSGQLTGLTTVQYSGEPGSDAATIFVRGQGTWEDSSPLIQVDGVERSFNEIDPNEIESISILKDASATAVFGVRGANGVVLITTKRGQEGKAKISFTTSASVIAPTATIEKANAYQYAMFYNQMQKNDNPDATPMFSDEVIQKFKDHSDPIRFPDTDWVNYCLKNTAIQTQHNINISGGTKTVRYFLSAGAYTQNGLFKQFDLPYDLSYQYNRFNYRSNLDIDVTKTTTISLNLGGSVDNTHKPYTGQGAAGMLKNMYWATPFSSPGLVNGKMVYTTTEYGLPFVGGSGMTYYGGGFMGTSNNKLTSDVILNQKLNFITKGLSMRIKGSYNGSFVNRKNGVASIATYTPVLMSDGTIAYKKSGANSQISYQENDGDQGIARDWYMEAAFDYDRTFGNHHVSGLLLYNQSKEYYPSEYSDIPRGYVGLVGRATYDWKSRYMLELNVGYNGSENFAPDKRFGTFPAGSVGWVVSEEKFWDFIKPVVNYMKLRVSMGLVGNDKIGGNRFMYTPDPYGVNNNTSPNRLGYGYNFGINNGTLSYGAYEQSKHNADVTWEKAFKQNYGMDFSLLSDRLKASVDYYKEHRKDILLSDGTAPLVLGFTLPPANLGIVNSWGWELSLKWSDMINPKFRYFVGFNLSNNQNKIIERKEAPLNNDYQYSKGHRIGARSLYQFFEYYNENTPQHYKEAYGEEFPTQLQTLQNGDCVYVDLDHNGKIDTNDMSRALGHTDDPEYLAGVNMGFSWKNLDVSLQWTGAWDVTRMIDDLFRRPFISGSTNNQGGLLRYHVENTWTEENPSQSAAYPRATWVNATNNYAASTLYEQDASYLRLKSLQVAYNFHFPFMQKMKLNTCQLSFSGYNLLTFTDYMWGDPESTATGSPTYPLTKTYSLSLKLGF